VPTADPVKDYLRQIGGVPLLNAEQEVWLAKRIEAGLFAAEKLNSGERLGPELRRELDIIAEDGRHTVLGVRLENSWLARNLPFLAALLELGRKCRAEGEEPGPPANDA